LRSAIRALPAIEHGGHHQLLERAEVGHRRHDARELVAELGTALMRHVRADRETQHVLMRA